MHSMATMALGAFAIIFFCAALMVGIVILKKYQTEKERLKRLSDSQTSTTNTEKTKNKKHTN